MPKNANPSQNQSLAEIHLEKQRKFYFHKFQQINTAIKELHDLLNDYVYHDKVSKNDNFYQYAMSRDAKIVSKTETLQNKSKELQDLIKILSDEKFKKIIAESSINATDFSYYQSCLAILNKKLNTLQEQLASFSSLGHLQKSLEEWNTTIKNHVVQINEHLAKINEYNFQKKFQMENSTNQSEDNSTLLTTVEKTSIATIPVNHNPEEDHNKQQFVMEDQPQLLNLTSLPEEVLANITAKLSEKSEKKSVKNRKNFLATSKFFWKRYEAAKQEAMRQFQSKFPACFAKITQRSKKAINWLAWEKALEKFNQAKKFEEIVAMRTPDDEPILAWVVRMRNQPPFAVSEIITKELEARTYYPYFPSWPAMPQKEWIKFLKDLKDFDNPSVSVHWFEYFLKIRGDRITYTDADTIFVIAAAGGKINVPDGKGRTPLYHAITQRPDLVKALIQAGVDVNEHGNSHFWNTTPLKLAIKFDRLELVKFLLTEGANVNDNYGLYETVTPLWSAIFKGNDSIVLSLLKAGAMLDEREISAFRAIQNRNPQKWINFAIESKNKEFQDLVHPKIKKEEVIKVVPSHQSLRAIEIFEANDDLKKSETDEKLKRAAMIEELNKKINQSPSVCNFFFASYQAKKMVLEVLRDEILNRKDKTLDQIWNDWKQRKFPNKKYGLNKTPTEILAIHRNLFRSAESKGPNDKTESLKFIEDFEKKHFPK